VAMEPSKDITTEEVIQEVKWDYTSSRETMITGAAVVGANVLVIVVYFLYRYVPAVHQFISGKTI
tara:strand:- start:39 stop:233 length:195 start_codon:yes stop_codon:yes gene_type:complete